MNYRLLNRGETMQDGDEALAGPKDEKWEAIPHWCVGMPYRPSNNPVRRLLDVRLDAESVIELNLRTTFMSISAYISGLSTMCDGEAYVAGLAKHGFDPRGRRALLVGAGGAGSALAHSLVDAGVSALALHDIDIARRDALIGKIARYDGTRAEAGSADPRGFDLVINATPAGMRADDPDPVEHAGLEAGMFVGDVITAPAVTPLLAAARSRGCRTMTGLDMFEAVGERIAAFYLEQPWTSA